MPPRQERSKKQPTEFDTETRKAVFTFFNIVRDNAPPSGNIIHYIAKFVKRRARQQDYSSITHRAPATAGHPT